jgi:hypothetical protein
MEEYININSKCITIKNPFHYSKEFENQLIIIINDLLKNNENINKIEFESKKIFFFNYYLLL